MTENIANVLGGVSGARREEIIFSYKKHYKPHSLLQVFHQSLNTKQRKKGTKKIIDIRKKPKSQNFFSKIFGHL